MVSPMLGNWGRFGMSPNGIPKFVVALFNVLQFTEVVIGRDLKFHEDHRRRRLHL